MKSSNRKITLRFGIEVVILLIIIALPIIVITNDVTNVSKQEARDMHISEINKLTKYDDYSQDEALIDYEANGINLSDDGNTFEITDQEKEIVIKDVYPRMLKKESEEEDKYIIIDRKISIEDSIIFINFNNLDTYENDWSANSDVNKTFDENTDEWYFNEYTLVFTEHINIRNSYIVSNVIFSQYEEPESIEGYASMPTLSYEFIKGAKINIDRISLVTLNLNG